MAREPRQDPVERGKKDWHGKKEKDRSDIEVLGIHMTEVFDDVQGFHEKKGIAQSISRHPPGRRLYS